MRKKNIKINTNNKPMATLKLWCIDGRTLHGDVYGHKRFGDGTFIRTSDVVNVAKEDGCFFFETRNTMYICEEADKLRILRGVK